ncbi:MAG: EMC3/TMCO1 family protein [Candidatus Micrarchaeia archaeon]
MTILGLPLDGVLVLVAFALAYIGITILLQRKLVNTKRLRELQMKSSMLAKELKEMAKAQASNEELLAKQREMFPIMSETMKAQLKPMLVILPLYLAIAYLALPTVIKPFATKTTNFAVYQSFFFILILVIGMIAQGIIMVYDRRKMKQEFPDAYKKPASEPGQ